jgi:uncharacterized protein (TIGR02246 family)
MTKIIGALVGLAVLFGSPAFAHDQAETTKAVDGFVATFLQKYNAKDAEGVAALYAADGILVPPGAIVGGHDNLVKAWKATFDAGRTGLRYAIQQIQPEGNIVLVVGGFAVQTPVNGALKEVDGNFVNVYEWDGDGLKFRVHSFNFNPPKN